MGQTIAEKILAAHADREVVRPGEFVVVRVDLVLPNDITGPPTITQFRRMGGTGVFDPDRVALVPDHFTPPKDATPPRSSPHFARMPGSRGSRTIGKWARWGSSTRCSLRRGSSGRG